MAFFPKDIASKCDGGFRMPPPSPSRATNAIVEIPNSNQMDQRKPESSKLTIMGQLCFKALQIIDGTRPKNNGQILPACEITNASTSVVRHTINNGNPSAIPDNSNFNINNNQHSMSLQQYKSGYFKSRCNEVMPGISRLNAGSVKPIKVTYDEFYRTLMELDEPVLDEIIGVIDNAQARKVPKKKSKRSFSQKRFATALQYDKDSDDDSSDEIVEVNDSQEGHTNTNDNDNDEDEPIQECESKRVYRRPPKKINYSQSAGFKNFFKTYIKKNPDKSGAEVLQCAKEAYKNLSSSSRSRYRNLKRAKAAEAARRKAKQYTDTESN